VKRITRERIEEARRVAAARERGEVASMTPAVRGGGSPWRRERWVPSDRSQALRTKAGGKQ
jgi:hypothetical protein